jgi:hypothetical protein
MMLVDIHWCGYTLRVTSQASYSPVYITPTQKKLLTIIDLHFLLTYCIDANKPNLFTQTDQGRLYEGRIALST